MFVFVLRCFCLFYLFGGDHQVPQQLDGITCLLKPVWIRGTEAKTLQMQDEHSEGKDMKIHNNECRVESRDVGFCLIIMNLKVSGAQFRSHPGQVIIYVGCDVTYFGRVANDDFSTDVFPPHLHLNSNSVSRLFCSISSTHPPGTRSRDREVNSSSLFDWDLQLHIKGDNAKIRSECNSVAPEQGCFQTRSLRGFRCGELAMCVTLNCAVLPLARPDVLHFEHHVVLDGAGVSPDQDSCFSLQQRGQTPHLVQDCSQELMSVLNTQEEFILCLILTHHSL